MPEEQPLHRLAPLRCGSEAKYVVWIVILLQVGEYGLALHDGDDGRRFRDI